MLTKLNKRFRRQEGGQVSSSIIPCAASILASQRPSLHGAFSLPLQLLWVKRALRNTVLFLSGLLFCLDTWFCVDCWRTLCFQAFFFFNWKKKLSSVHCKQMALGAVITTLIFPLIFFSTGKCTCFPYIVDCRKVQKQDFSQQHPLAQLSQ